VGWSGQAGLNAGSASAVALLDQRLGLREVGVGGIPDPEFEVTGAKVTDAANVTAESLYESGNTPGCRA